MWLIGFQLKTSSGRDTFYVAKTDEYVSALKVAILSARAQAPSLLPVVVLTGPDSSEGVALRKWLHRHGTVTIHHILSFQKDMDALSRDPHWAFSQNILGSWLRVDLPNVLRALQRAQGSSQIPKHLAARVAAVGREYVLWTDADIIFRGPVDSCTLAKPQILSVGPELRMGWPENYGVIYFNVSAYTAGFRDLIAWGRQHKFRFDHDQNLFLGYWGTAVDTLPNGMNWKPYWGNTSMAIPGHFNHELIRIVHFHGPKLYTAGCFFDELEESIRSGKDSTPVDRLRRCGLRDAPNGKAEWLKGLADILTASYKQDGGHFYRELLGQYGKYLILADSDEDLTRLPRTQLLH